MTTGSYKTRFSYASGEVAGQLIFSVISFYILKFYTDVYGISAAAAGMILLVARCVDSLDAPLWGIVFDKTHSRFGKSRPWFLWLSVPFALFGALTFVTPHVGATAKIIYAIATYVTTSVLYTGINTPMTSILSALTPETDERMVLTSFRMFGSKLGVLFVNMTVLPLVSLLGHGNDRRGFLLTMPIYAISSVAFYLIAFRNLRETVPEQRQHVSVRGSFGALKQNGPWWIIFLSSLCFWVAFIARISSAPYFFQYVLHRPELISMANGLDFVSLGSILFLPFLCRHISKQIVWMVGLIGAMVAQFVVFVGADHASILWVMLGWAFGFLMSGLAMAMPFSMLADTVDYGEWKSGVRAAGLLTAIGAAFCLKAGSGLGGALPAWTLAQCGYVPNAVQSLHAIRGIELSCIWLPALAYALAVFPVLFYDRYERMEPLIQHELEERRRLNEMVSESL